MCFPPVPLGGLATNPLSILQLLSYLAGRPEVMTDGARAELAAFVGQSVVPSTTVAYEGHWLSWQHFLAEETELTDPLLRTLAESEKSQLVALFMKRRHDKGMRGKGAHAVTASLRLHFSSHFQPTECFDSRLIKAARAACRRTIDEMHDLRDAEVVNNVKLPFCWELLLDMRRRLWFGQPWEGAAITGRMTYLACLWGYDQSARIGEYTVREGNGSDHCVRVHDLSFTYDEGNGPHYVAGGHPFFQRITLEPHLISMVQECRVMGVSTKGKKVVKPKVIARRSDTESNFLSDLVLFLSHSCSVGPG